METRPKPLNLAKIDREKVKKKRSFGFGSKRDEFPFVFGASDLIHVLQVCGFAAQAGSVIHDFAVNFPGYVVYEGQRCFLGSMSINNFSTQ
jgi:hypothetical protein